MISKNGKFWCRGSAGTVKRNKDMLALSLVTRRDGGVCWQTCSQKLLKRLFFSAQNIMVGCLQEILVSHVEWASRWWRLDLLKCDHVSHWPACLVMARMGQTARKFESRNILMKPLFFDLRFTLRRNHSHSWQETLRWGQSTHKHTHICKLIAASAA